MILISDTELCGRLYGLQNHLLLSPHVAPIASGLWRGWILVREENRAVEKFRSRCMAFIDSIMLIVFFTLMILCLLTVRSRQPGPR